MVINRFEGTATKVYANDRVRIATVDSPEGRRTWDCYVMHTKTLHEFNNPNTMLDFVQHMGLIPAVEPLTRSQFKTRLYPFIARLHKERCKPKMDFYPAMEALTKEHTQVRIDPNNELMNESTWTEFDDEVLFLAPYGVYMIEGHDNPEPILHYKGNGWIYEMLDEILIEILEVTNPNAAKSAHFSNNPYLN